MAQHLAEVVAGRADATARALDALRLQYPDHAETLERRFLQQSGLRLLVSRYRDLFDEGLIGGELFHNLEHEHSARLLTDKLPPLDLGLQTEELIGSFSMFAGLEAAELKALARLFRPRLLVPDETRHPQGRSRPRHVLHLLGSGRGGAAERSGCGSAAAISLARWRCSTSARAIPTSSRSATAGCSNWPPPISSAFCRSTRGVRAEIEQTAQARGRHNRPGNDASADGSPVDASSEAL